MSAIKKAFKNKHLTTLTVILALTLVLRIPTFFEPPWFFDEGIYSLIARENLLGRELYSEIWDHKPPFLFYIYALGELINRITGLSAPFGAKILAGVSVITTQIILYKISQQVFKKKHIRLIPPLIYGLLTSLPFWEGFMANGEVLMTPFSLAALYLLWKDRPAPINTRSLIASGALLASAALIKPVAIAEITLALFYITSRNRPGSQRVICDLAYLAVGFGLVAGTSLSYFVAKGNLQEFFQANLAYNLTYSGGILGPADKTGILVIRILLMATSFWLTRRKASSWSSVLVSWLSLDILTVTLSLRPYLHYLIQAFPPITMLTALFLERKNRGELPAAASYLYLLPFLSLLFMPLNQTFNITSYVPHQFDSPYYYSNFIKYITGNKSRQAYSNFFGTTPSLNRKIVNYWQTKHSQIKGHTLIWGGGEAPWLYYQLSHFNLHPATKYTNYFHATENKTNPRPLRDLFLEVRNSPPEVIILFPHSPTIPGLESFLKKHYHLTHAIENVELFLLSPWKNPTVLPYESP